MADAQTESGPLEWDGLSDDPPGINPTTHDLPSVADAAERVGEFLRWYGDGRVVVAADEDGPPLFARDLEAIRQEVSRG